MLFFDHDESHLPLPNCGIEVATTRAPPYVPGLEDTGTAYRSLAPFHKLFTLQFLPPAPRTSVDAVFTDVAALDPERESSMDLIRVTSYAGLPSDHYFILILSLDLDDPEFDPMIGLENSFGLGNWVNSQVTAPGQPLLDVGAHSGELSVSKCILFVPT